MPNSTKIEDCGDHVDFYVFSYNKNCKKGLNKNDENLKYSVVY